MIPEKFVEIHLNSVSFICDDIGFDKADRSVGAVKTGHYAAVIEMIDVKNFQPFDFLHGIEIKIRCY